MFKTIKIPIIKTPPTGAYYLSYNNMITDNLPPLKLVI